MSSNSGVKRESEPYSQNSSSQGEAKKPSMQKLREPTLYARDATSLTITWKAVDGAVGYRVRYRRLDDQQWFPIGSSDNPFVKSTACKKNNLATGVAYVFGCQPWFGEVLGTNEWGWSSTSAALTPLDESPNEWQPFYALSAEENDDKRSLALSDILCEDARAAQVPHPPKVERIYLFTMVSDCKNEDALEAWLGDWGTNKSGVPVHIFHGMGKHVKEDELGAYSRVSFAPVMVNDSHGTHHSKLCVVFYDAGVRLAIITANLCCSELSDLTQAAWVQDFPLKAEGAQAGESQFENDLCEYLAHIFPALRPNHTRNVKAESRLASLVAKLRRHDFGAAEVALIPSVPGRHATRADSDEVPAMESLGHVKLHALLGDEADPPSRRRKAQTLTIGMQCSSLGSLGKNESFLCELAASMRSIMSRQTTLGWDEGGQGSPKQGKKGKKDKQDKEYEAETALRQIEDVEVVWPDVATVGRARGGYAAGDLLPCPSKALRAEDGPPGSYKAGVQQCLRKWDGVSGGRVPNIQSYYRYFVADDGHAELLWVYLGSHSLCAASWGALELKNHQLHCRSYDLGVLFLPSRVTRASRAFSLTPAHKLLGYQKGVAKPAPAEPFQQAKPTPRFIASNLPGPRDAATVHFPLPHRIKAPAYDWPIPGLDNTPWASDLEILTKDCKGKTREGRGFHAYNSVLLLHNE